MVVVGRMNWFVATVSQTDWADRSSEQITPPVELAVSFPPFENPVQLFWVMLSPPLVMRTPPEKVEDAVVLATLITPARVAEALSESI